MPPQAISSASCPAGNRYSTPFDLCYLQNASGDIFSLMSSWQQVFRHPLTSVTCRMPPLAISSASCPVGHFPSASPRSTQQKYIFLFINNIRYRYGIVKVICCLQYCVIRSAFDLKLRNPDTFLKNVQKIKSDLTRCTKRPAANQCLTNMYFLKIQNYF